MPANNALLISHLISHWREEVWQNALRWLDTSAAAEQEARRRQIETTTLKHASAILLGQGILALRYLFWATAGAGQTCSLTAVPT